jgi:hypothetical protein
MFLTKFQSIKLRIKLYMIGQILNAKYKTRAGNTYRKNTPAVLFILSVTKEPLRVIG